MLPAALWLHLYSVLQITYSYGQQVVNKSSG